MDFVYGDLTDKPVLGVACGFAHTTCFTEDGDVYSWGNGKMGALGHKKWD
jgi:alpha-tubulin suppressor-like RCC1 family protein